MKSFEDHLNNLVIKMPDRKWHVGSGNREVVTIVYHMLKHEFGRERPDIDPDPVQIPDPEKEKSDG